MNEADKLRVLLEHWIEHNSAHQEEFETWAGRASEAGMTETATEISAASKCLRQASERLRNALAGVRPEA